MAAEDMHEAPRCQHVRLRGKQCLAPARRGTNYCLFHEAEHRNEDKMAFPAIEDAASVAVATDQVIRALKDDTIDYGRAGLLFSGLRLARINLRQLGLELGDEVEPTLANPARVGHAKMSKEEEELEKMPEMLLENLYLLGEEDEEFRGKLPTREEIAAAKARGDDLGKMLMDTLEKMEEKEPLAAD